MALLFSTIFSRIFVQKTTLKIRDIVFFQIKEQVGLLSSIIKVMSPFKAKVRQVCLPPIIQTKDSSI